MTEQNEHTVAETVSQYLQDCHPDGITFTVIEEEVKQDEFGWKVPVLLDKEPRKLFPYYEALADVEIALADEAHLKVLLIPAFDLIDAAQEARDAAQKAEAA